MKKVNIKLDTVIKILILFLAITYAIGELFYLRLGIGVVTVLLVVYNILKNRSNYRDRAYIILAIFFGLNILSTIINYSTFNKYNCIELINMFLLFFGVMGGYSKRVDFFEKSKFIYFYNYVAFLLGIIALIMYVLNVHGYYYLDKSIEFYGVYEGRLWGLVNANITSFIATVAIIFCVILYKREKSRFNSINLVIQIHVFLLAQSRAMWAVVIAIAILYIVYYKKYRKNKIYVATIALLAAFFLYSLSYLYISYVTVLPVKLVSHIRYYITDGNEEDEEIRATRLINKDSVTQGRTELWKDTIVLIKKSPIIGNGLYEIKYEGVKYFGERWGNVVRLAGVHNIYIMILVVGGAVSLVVFIIFIMSVIFRFGKYLVKEDKDKNKTVMLIMLLCIMLFFEELIESRMLYTLNYYSYMFWLLLGYGLNKVIKSEKDNSYIMKNTCD